MKFLMLQALFICAIFGTATNVYADEVKQKELYTLEILLGLKNWFF